MNFLLMPYCDIAEHQCTRGELVAAADAMFPGDGPGVGAVRLAMADSPVLSLLPLLTQSQCRQGAHQCAQCRQTGEILWR